MQIYISALCVDDTTDHDSLRVFLVMTAQIRALGDGGSCGSCSPQQQQGLNKMMVGFDSGLRTKWPSYYRHIAPHIRRVLPTA